MPCSHRLMTLLLAAGLGLFPRPASAQTAARDHPLPSTFRWNMGPALVSPRHVAGIDCYSVKDPSVVRYEDRWHLFCTIRGRQRSHAVVYLSFDDWQQADRAQRHLLPMHDGYFCAPQVFYFSPQRLWYLICQAASDAWNPRYQPAFATTPTISDPQSWSKLTPLYDRQPDNIRAWLDFWVICDQSRAHLFFTSLDGKMWRAETALNRFPRGWSRPEVALDADVYEASHTYRLQGSGQFLTVIEARGRQDRRYYKAYTAERLDGPWRPLAAEADRPFASFLNVTPLAAAWTDSISHGELLRSGYDEHMEVDPGGLRFLFQGVLDRERAGKSYGEIPWRLGLLEPADASAPAAR